MARSETLTDRVNSRRRQDLSAGIPIVSAEDLTKVYRRGSELVHALNGVSFALRRGEFAAIMGPSGAGKTTLLNLLGCMDTPSSGKLRLDGKEVQDVDESELTALRRSIGFVFQHFSLLPTLTVAENIALPALFARRDADGKINALLERVGLSHRRNHRPDQLSGGEMQRAAIARALINDPKILLADEPTANLDSATGGEIIHLFKSLNEGGLTIAVVTHNAAMSGAATRQLLMRDGKLAER
jgi:ABC-type lipoprotein export system ATPase subunit